VSIGGLVNGVKYDVFVAFLCSFCLCLSLQLLVAAVLLGALGSLGLLGGLGRTVLVFEESSLKT